MQLQKRILLYAGGVVFYLLVIAGIVHFESEGGGNIKDLGDGLWYAIVTLSTVGYGDYYPVTLEGRILGLTLILGSISILGVLVAELTGYINSYLQKQKLGMLGTKFSNHFVIAGKPWSWCKISTTGNRFLCFLLITATMKNLKKQA